MKSVSPGVALTAFNCPYCGAYAHQQWYSAAACDLHEPPANKINGRHNNPSVFAKMMKIQLDGYNTELRQAVRNVFMSRCSRCDEISLWYRSSLIYPSHIAAPLAHADTPAEILSDYDEARAIASASPRSAAALLRLALEKLCDHLGANGKNIYDKIGDLVSKGLPVHIQQAMDAMRVVGNNAVHPLQMNVSEDPKTVSALFLAFNLTVESMITSKLAMEKLFGTLPDGAKAAIEKRDGKALPAAPTEDTPS